MDHRVYVFCRKNALKVSSQKHRVKNVGLQFCLPRTGLFVHGRKDIKSEEVDLDVYTVNSGDCRSNRSRNVY